MKYLLTLQSNKLVQANTKLKRNVREVKEQLNKKEVEVRKLQKELAESKQAAMVVKGEEEKKSDMTQENPQDDYNRTKDDDVKNNRDNYREAVSLVSHLA